MSTEVRLWRLKSVPALKELKHCVIYHLNWPHVRHKHSFLPGIVVWCRFLWTRWLRLMWLFMWIWFTFWVRRLFTVRITLSIWVSLVCDVISGVCRRHIPQSSVLSDKHVQDSVLPDSTGVHSYLPDNGLSELKSKFHLWLCFSSRIRICSFRISLDFWWSTGPNRDLFTVMAGKTLRRKSAFILYSLWSKCEQDLLVWAPTWKWQHAR